MVVIFNRIYYPRVREKEAFVPTVYSSFGFAFDTNVYSSDTREHWHNQRMSLQFLFDTNYLFSLSPYFFFRFNYFNANYFLANIHLLKDTFCRIIISPFTPRAFISSFLCFLPLCFRDPLFNIGHSFSRSARFAEPYAAVYEIIVAGEKFQIPKAQ